MQQVNNYYLWQHISMGDWTVGTEMSSYSNMYWDFLKVVILTNLTGTESVYFQNGDHLHCCYLASMLIVALIKENVWICIFILWLENMFYWENSFKVALWSYAHCMYILYVHMYYVQYMNSNYACVPLVFSMIMRINTSSANKETRQLQ